MRAREEKRAAMLERAARNADDAAQATYDAEERAEAIAKRVRAMLEAFHREGGLGPWAQRAAFDDIQEMVAEMNQALLEAYGATCRERATNLAISALG